MPDHESKCPSCGAWHSIALGAKNTVPGEAECPHCDSYVVREIRPKNAPESSQRGLETFFEN
jgi:endogenous inhibitor of DNA gyrase (YacG/DUF329 family)